MKTLKIILQSRLQNIGRAHLERIQGNTVVYKPYILSVFMKFTIKSWYGWYGRTLLCGISGTEIKQRKITISTYRGKYCRKYENRIDIFNISAARAVSVRPIFSSFLNFIICTTCVYIHYLEISVEATLEYKF